MFLSPWAWIPMVCILAVVVGPRAYSAHREAKHDALMAHIVELERVVELDGPSYAQDWLDARPESLSPITSPDAKSPETPATIYEKNSLGQ